MSVRRCQQEVDSREFERWKRYYEIEPWGEEPTNYRMGILRADLNVLHGGKPIKPEKLAPKFGKHAPQPQSGREMMAILSAIPGGHNEANRHGKG